jgi:hypothetical protein
MVQLPVYVDFHGNKYVIGKTKYNGEYLLGIGVSKNMSIGCEGGLYDLRTDHTGHMFIIYFNSTGNLVKKTISL